MSERPDRMWISWTPTWSTPVAHEAAWEGAAEYIRADLVAAKDAEIARLRAAVTPDADLDCHRCRGDGCEECDNTGRRMVKIPLSDANNLDAVVHALGIEDSDTTPAEAVAELHARIECLESQLARSDAAMTAIRAITGVTHTGRPTAHAALSQIDQIARRTLA